jgi:uncharacterized RmlC-like cupin family protein
MDIRERDLSTLLGQDEPQGGWSLFFLEAAGIAPLQARDIHVISVPPGAVRGNHIHRGSTEWLLVWGGRARLLWVGGGSTKEFIIDGTRPRLFKVPPGIPHALENMSEENVYVLAFADGERSTTPFTLRNRRA